MRSIFRLFQLYFFFKVRLDWVIEILLEEVGP